MEMRERILEKADELFMKHGIKRITMDEIAGRLGISKKTIYQSFADKNEIVCEIFDRYMCGCCRNCEADLQNSNNAVHEVFLASQTFRNIMYSINSSVMYDLEKYHPEIFKKFLEFKNGYLYRSILENLKRGIREGLYKDDINVEVIARLRMSNIILVLDIELFPAQQFHFTEVEHELTMHFLQGIVTKKGAAVMHTYNQAVTGAASAIS